MPMVKGRADWTEVPLLLPNEKFKYLWPGVVFANAGTATPSKAIITRLYPKRDL